MKVESSFTRRETMYVSRLTFHTHPGKTHEVEQELQTRVAMVRQAGGGRPHILRNHFASLGAPDLAFEHEAPDLGALEPQIAQVTKRKEFQQWSSHMSELLAQSPKGEVYLMVE